MQVIINRYPMVVKYYEFYCPYWENGVIVYEPISFVTYSYPL